MMTERDILAATGYRTLGTLGQGTMGHVVEAEHAVFGRVVVKVLHQALADRPDLVDRMRLEVEVLAMLDHPNIVRLLDSGITRGGCPFLVMERLAGFTLREEIAARGRLDVPSAVEFARQALAGLSAAHAKGIVHRDIKPANLFLSASRRGPRVLKILDFGVAKVMTNAGRGVPAPLYAPTAPGTTVGTPRFLSPEQIRGRPLDPRADLYALGLVLYVMLTGRGPFDDIGDLAEMLRAHLSLFPPLPSSLVPEVPRWLDRIIMKALAKRPEDRFGSAAEILAQIERASTAARVHQRRSPMPAATIPLSVPPAEALTVTLPSPGAAAEVDAEDRTTLRVVCPRPRRAWIDVRLAAATALGIMAAVMIVWVFVRAWSHR